MAWIKYPIIAILFYLFAVLQNSFFAHFSLFGAVPNLVLIFFISFVFLEQKNSYYPVIFYAICAGLFLDFFSYTYFGVSMILLLALGLLIKKTQTLLQEKRDNKFPLMYFLPLFTVSLLIYDLLFSIFINSFRFEQILLNFNLSYAVEVIHNLLIAFVVFYILKKFFRFSFDNRQLSLFK